AGCEGAQSASDTDLARVFVHSYFHELAPERVQGELLALLFFFARDLGTDFSLSRTLEPGAERLTLGAHRELAGGQRDVSRARPEQRGFRVAHHRARDLVAQRERRQLD